MYDTNSFSMLFGVPDYHQPYDESDVYSSYSSSPDCTLSLGTPSTRNNNRDKKSSAFSNWNIFKPKQKHTPAVTNNNCRNVGSDPLVGRRCANCDTTSTPLWRNGPRGPKSLCNACGIRFKKEERRAATAASTTTATSGAQMEHQYIINNSWAHQNSQIYPYYSQTTPHHADVGSGIPFFAWGLNVTDRTSFVHY